MSARSHAEFITALVVACLVDAAAVVHYSSYLFLYCPGGSTRRGA
jgi:hypothetical protein